jgi:hypothetical protein
LSRAIELNPGWPLARQYQAVSFVAQSRHREAVHQLDPDRHSSELCSGGGKDGG